MNHRIESVFIGKEYFNDYEILGTENFLANLSTINVFIGANNSGKSRFTRTLFEKDDLGYRFKGIDLANINGIIENFKADLKKYHDINQLNDYAGIKSNFLESIHSINYIDNEFDLDTYFLSYLKRLQTVGGNEPLSEYSPMVHYRDELGKNLRQLGTKYIHQIEELQVKNYKMPNHEKIYIPTLRGLRTVGVSNGTFSHDDIFLRRTVKDYFKADANFDSRIYTGLRLYEDTKALLLGPSEDRKRIRDFEEFLSSSFFNGQRVNIIPRQGDDVVHVLIGNNERPIYELGDGIQAIIILTYPLFFNQGKELKIFIEEPEHYLHPGFQRILLETLVKPQFSTYQYFITTHSNHFLDITLDIDSISVYTFKGEVRNEEQKFVIENVENEDANILELLGVRNASVFLSNCTIWVEGITDRIYIRKYLEVYQRSSEVKEVFKEDTHYSFVEYGGGNVTHWSFLYSSDVEHPNIAVERLCGKLFLVSDKDGAGIEVDGKPNKEKTKKYERHLELKKALGDRYYCLISREIENTLGPSVLEATVREYEASKKGSQNLIFDGFEYFKYKDKPIGKFIEEQVDGIARSYAADSGTIKDKVNFAKKSVKYIKTFDDLTDDAKNLTRMIYKFIRNNNC